MQEGDEPVLIPVLPPYAVAAVLGLLGVAYWLHTNRRPTQGQPAVAADADAVRAARLARLGAPSTSEVASQPAVPCVPTGLAAPAHGAASTTKDASAVASRAKHVPAQKAPAEEPPTPTPVAAPAPAPAPAPVAAVKSATPPRPMALANTPISLDKALEHAKATLLAVAAGDASVACWERMMADAGAVTIVEPGEPAIEVASQRLFSALVTTLAGTAPATVALEATLSALAVCEKPTVCPRTSPLLHSSPLLRDALAKYTLGVTARRAVVAALRTVLHSELPPAVTAVELFPPLPVGGVAMGGGMFGGMGMGGGFGGGMPTFTSAAPPSAATAPDSLTAAFTAALVSGRVPGWALECLPIAIATPEDADEALIAFEQTVDIMSAALPLLLRPLGDTAADDPKPSLGALLTILLANLAAPAALCRLLEAEASALREKRVGGARAEHGTYVGCLLRVGRPAAFGAELSNPLRAKVTNLDRLVEAGDRELQYVAESLQRGLATLLGGGQQAWLRVLRAGGADGREAVLRWFSAMLHASAPRAEVIASSFRMMLRPGEEHARRMRLIREASSDELLTNAWATLLRLCEPFLTFDARGEPSAETLAKLEPAAHYTRTAATHHRIDYANVYTTLAGRIHASRGMASGAGSDYFAAVAAAGENLCLLYTCF